MSAVHWLNAVDGTFNDAADWSGGQVPNRFDDAILDAAGSDFTVSVRSDRTVNSVQLAANATLDLIAGTFTATNGTGVGVNAGTISVGPNAGMIVGGSLDNAGLIEIAIPGSDAPSFLAFASNTTLSGGGTVTSAARSRFDIEAAPGAGGVVLTNADNTIVGSGYIGVHGGLGVVNESDGVIDAGHITFGNSSVRSDLTNDGLLTCDKAGFFIGYDLGISGSGGKITSSGSVLLNDCDVSGQTLSTKATGSITFAEGSTLTVSGVIKNAGAIRFPDQVVFEHNVTLEGGGTAFLSSIAVTRRSTILANVDNTIVGTGVLGNDSLTLVNDARGVVETVFGTGQLPNLIIDTGENTIVNERLIQAATNEFPPPKMVMDIDSPIDNSGVLTVGSGATIAVAGAVSGSGQATIIGGGLLDFESSFNQDVTFNQESNGNSGILELAQSQAFTSTLSGFSADGKSKLKLLDIQFVSKTEATFSGTASSGLLTVTDGIHTANINLVGDYLGATFVASSDGKKGVDIVATGGQTPAIAHFIGAMAAMGGHGAAAGLFDARAVNDGGRIMLTAPRPAIA